MLKYSLYTITSLDHQAPMIYATLLINENNKIFDGHFPGQPVLPGACMLQILKEVFEETLNRQYQLRKADQIKFLTLIDPRVTTTLQLNISYKPADNNTIYVTADMIAEGTIFFKFKGYFVNEAA